MTKDNLSICQLCDQKVTLRKSHIIPHFVVNWQKQRGTGYIRNNNKPNLPVQDGLKTCMLCDDCEEIFSKWEKPFAENIFIPLHRSSGKAIPLKYSDWCIRFAVSISWRVLNWIDISKQCHLNILQKEKAKKALSIWKSFLKAESKSPVEFVQHIIPLDVIEDTSKTTGFSPYLNRYLIGPVDLDIISTKTSCFVYAKLCRLLIIGFIEEQNPENWGGTRLYLKRGTIGHNEYIMPPFFYWYFNNRANYMKSILNNLSEKQQHKHFDFIKNNPEKVIHSESFEALLYDLKYTGKNAFMN